MAQSLMHRQRLFGGIPTIALVTSKRFDARVLDGMRFQQTPIIKLLLANIALVRCIAIVHFALVHKTRMTRYKLLIAIRACKWFFTSVLWQMIAQQIRHRKCFVAIGARVRFVQSRQMQTPCIAGSKRTITMRAFVRTFAGMCAHVHRQRFGRFRTVLALGARKRSLIGVCAQMLLIVEASMKSHTAFCAQKFLCLRVAQMRTSYVCF